MNARFPPPRSASPEQAPGGRPPAAIGGGASCCCRPEELARLGGFRELRDFGIPEDELPEVASATAQRPGAKANPRTVTVAEVEALLRSIY
jgi:hypothetical protein